MRHDSVLYFFQNTSNRSMGLEQRSYFAKPVPANTHHAHMNPQGYRHFMLSKLLAMMLAAVFCCPLWSLYAMPLSSPQGQQWFKQSLQGKTLDLLNYHSSQITTSFCGIASAVTILNTLIHDGSLNINKHRPLQQTLDPRFLPGELITQSSLFYLPALKDTYRVVQYRGLTLPQLAEVLRAYPLQVEHRNGQELSLAQFRRDLTSFHSNRQQHMIVNYYRPGLKQPGGGHFSPVAAYHAQQDQVLILDTSTYKHRFFWVSSKQLWQAMRPHEKCKLGRGYLLVTPQQ